MSRALAELDRSERFYNPAVGEVTLGQILAACRPEQTADLADPMEQTLAMWEFIATHPRTSYLEWLTFGATEPASGGLPSSASTSAGTGELSKSSGTSKGKGINGASST